MKKDARIRKRLVLLIAFSIVWIFIGSLVIFHQEQVLGKTFKFNTITFTVPKSKDEKSFAKVKADQSPTDSPHLFLALLDQSMGELWLSRNYAMLRPEMEESADVLFINRFRPLRAPPQA